jgi:hypothetical protein
MTSDMRLFYSSANGDRWFLFRRAETGNLCVRHEPTPSSGGLPTDTNVDDFLARNGPGPEFQELRRIMRTMPELRAVGGSP